MTEEEEINLMQPLTVEQEKEECQAMDEIQITLHAMTRYRVDHHEVAGRSDAT